jgi:hypothetical protein
MGGVWTLVKTEMTRPLLAVAGALAALAFAAPAARAACPAQPRDRVFLPWLDPAYYQAAPDSGFEAGDTWSLSGGAAVVDGNQPYLPGSKSLDLPAGSSATTAPICVTVAHPTIRFFARNTGSALAPLTVTVKFRTVLGLPVELPVGVALGGAQWQPTPPLLLVGNLLSDEVRFTLRAADGSAWQIDDVYVDPYSKG